MTWFSWPGTAPGWSRSRRSCAQRTAWPARSSSPTWPTGRSCSGWPIGSRATVFAEIGEILSLSPKTVETYRSRLMLKLGVRDLPSLVKFALEHGLTSSG